MSPTSALQPKDVQSLSCLGCWAVFVAPFPMKCPHCDASQLPPGLDPDDPELIEIRFGRPVERGSVRRIGDRFVRLGDQRAAVSAGEGDDAMDVADDYSWMPTALKHLFVRRVQPAFAAATDVVEPEDQWAVVRTLAVLGVLDPRDLPDGESSW